MEDSPETATYVGWHEFHDRWTDLSPDAIARRRADAGEPLDALHSIDRGSLSDGDRLSYDLFESEQRREVDASHFPSELLALDQLEGPQNDVPFLLSAMPLGTDAQHGDYLARLRGIPTVLEQTRALLEEGIRRGITVPAVCLRDVGAQFDTHLVDDVFEA